MSKLETLMLQVGAAVVLAIVLVLGWKYVIGQAEKRGYDRAVQDGQATMLAEAAKAKITEDTLRKMLDDKDKAAQTKENEYAENLKAAQRRARAGTDRLFCPGQVPTAATRAGGPAASEPAADAGGTPLVPDVAAEILGDAATAAGIVRKFDRLFERFEACRAVANTGQAPAQ